MDALIDEAWRIYQKNKDNVFVVQPSIPILLFGDSQRYFRSPLRVITVGLNPSLCEFPADSPFKRFPQAPLVNDGILDDQFYGDYLHALNDYFRVAPYRRWFGSFEPLLNGLDSSFYDGRTNTALHTDLCSPLATNPTWSRLSNHARREVDGTALWHQLVRHLNPDVLLVSVAKDLLSKLDFLSCGEWGTLYTIERTNPYHIKSRMVEINDGKKAILVFGQAANTPFGKISNLDKVEAGRRVGEYVRGR